MNEPRLVEVADGVYAYVQPDGSWFLNNAGLVVGPESAVVVDTCATEARTRAFLASIDALGDVEVRAVVNTHSHPDHTNGNYLFPAATVIAHESCRAEMLRPAPPTDGIWTPVEWGALERRLPDLTYRERLTLWTGDLAVEVIHPGRTAHTSGDSLVWIPERRVLFAGDLIFAGGTPFGVGGSIPGWIDTLESVVRPLPFEVLVPGHGEPCGPEAVDDVLDYLRFVWAAAQQAHAAGLSPLDAARELDLGRFSDLLDSERIVGNLHRAFADLGAPMSPGAAFHDMIALNGGQPLQCCA